MGKGKARRRRAANALDALQGNLHKAQVRPRWRWHAAGARMQQHCTQGTGLLGCTLTRLQSRRRRGALGEGGGRCL